MDTREHAENLTIEGGCFPWDAVQGGHQYFMTFGQP
jgi:hypothetical protein